MRKRLSARQFLKLAATNPEKVQIARFVLPRIGKGKGFGHFVIDERYPIKVV